MTKKKLFTLLSILGLIAFIVFLLIAFSPNESHSIPQIVIGISCFFIFLLIGIPSFTLLDNPDEFSLLKKNTESKK